MKAVIEIMKLVKAILKSLVIFAGCVISYSIFSRVLPPLDLYEVYQSYFNQASETYKIVNTALISVFSLIVVCVIGCIVQLKKSAAAAANIEKIKQLEQIVNISKVTVSQYEEFMFNYYNYVDKSVIEKIAPAKWILTTLEQKLNTINNSMYDLSNSQLSELLDEKITLRASPVEMVVFNSACALMPSNLNFVDCAYILKQIFDSVRLDLEEIELNASQNQYYSYSNHSNAFTR